MANRAAIQVTATITVDDIARVFCELDDDAQAQFFVKVGAIMEKWDGASRIMQLHAAGRHLRDCSCSTYEGRRVVEELYESMQPEEGCRRAAEKSTPKTVGCTHSCKQST
jgi:hypothetical protein